jgi:hypothetical protein
VSALSLKFIMEIIIAISRMTGELLLGGFIICAGVFLIACVIVSIWTFLRD